MFEATISPGSIIKKIFDAIKELITEASFDCSQNGICIQAMDSSHISMVNLMLRADGFDHFICDTNINLGVNMQDMGKILKCATNDDKITLRAVEDDKLSFSFEAKDAKRSADFDLKLINVEAEILGIPEKEYDAVIQLPSSEFAKICKELNQFGETIEIAATNNKVTF